ncbi:nudC domain-containing protein 2 isoform X2 [Hyla sarda]|uniref:nudC domain-containing protein 2 isoform X2 n=1 Tax=Hyla sarda TaxID=327740 RepID=UPI0024C23A91|nr:nudC domain-containing protein 2 isoform X2 [Hyla sarda]
MERKRKAKTTRLISGEESAWLIYSNSASQRPTNSRATPVQQRAPQPISDQHQPSNHTIEQLFQPGRLYDATISDESTWTLEDKKLIRIVLTKSNRDAGNCWPSLLEGEYSADPWVQDEMQKKLTLERFQRENPGFDFSGAEISGNYSKGGPDFSNL